MSNETENAASMANTSPADFGEVEIDAIGEIENITMGSAATAVSNLLNAKVWITTPKVKVVKVSDLVFPGLEPSVRVKIEYIEGVSGSSIMVLKQSDVQLMLNQLMGLPLEVTDDFEFDEMNISAVCEVMNQMMGASATALSELINTKIDISTPVASVTNENEVQPYLTLDPDENVVQISFNLTIDGIINSEFISVLTIDLAKMIAQKMLAGYGSELEQVSAEAYAQDDNTEEMPTGGTALTQEEIEKMMNAAAPEPAPSSGGTLSQEEIERLMNASAAATPQPAPQPVPQPAPQPVPQQQTQVPVQNPIPPQQIPPQMQGQPMPQQMYQQVPMMQGQPMPGQYYGYPPQMQGQIPPVNIQNVQLHSFDDYTPPSYLTSNESDNLQLLMNVPLTITVEIGSARKKVKEILDFSQGTIIELERQAGAPVDIIVNGNLIAKGDVVVIEDNFAVRVTEIIKSKFLETLGNKE